jgi:hypothetical protein
LACFWISTSEIVRSAHADIGQTVSVKASTPATVRIFVTAKPSNFLAIEEYEQLAPTAEEVAIETNVRRELYHSALNLYAHEACASYRPGWQTKKPPKRRLDKSD